MSIRHKVVYYAILFHLFFLTFHLFNSAKTRLQLKFLLNIASLAILGKCVIQSDFKALIWDKADHTPSMFLKVVFHKFYLVHS